MKKLAFLPEYYLTVIIIIKTLCLYLIYYNFFWTNLSFDNIISTIWKNIVKISFSYELYTCNAIFKYIFIILNTLLCDLISTKFIYLRFHQFYAILGITSVVYPIKYLLYVMNGTIFIVINRLYFMFTY